MTGKLEFSASDRVLVLAPHPDDETLAAGDVVRMALAAGAALRVVFATDGDNNPWPQRWLERRWRIGAPERARWGARRRDEALAALASLGAAPSAARFLGWPDQGLTALLMRDEAAVDALVEEIARFAPSHLVVPTLRDRHPDHSALRVLSDLAVLRTGIRCLRLGYVVHGDESFDPDRLLTAATGDPQAKRRAMEAHASQIALSRERLLALAARPNRFVPEEAVSATFGTPLALHLARASAWSLRRHELLLVVAGREETLRLRIPLPRRPYARATLPIGTRGGEVSLQTDVRGVRIELPQMAMPVRAVYAKLHREDPRLLIFDRERWRRDAELLRAPRAALAKSAESGLG